MDLQTIKTVVTSKVARQILITKKHSPKILFAVGTVAVVGAAVLACRATLQVSEVLDAAEKERDFISEEAGTEQITHEEAKKLLHGVQIKAGLQIARLYAPAVFVGIIGITSLTGSHVVLTKRNSALMAGYAALDRAYKEYRRRVAQDYGVDTDLKFAAGVTDKLVQEKLADGTSRTVVEPKLDGNPKNPYVHVFDQRSKKFSREPGRNPMTIAMVQNYANDKLRANGHLFLNEVLEMLGLPKTPTGQFVGWIYRHDNEEKNGDNYVDFGIFQGDAEWVEAFLDDQEKMVILNFNCDGPIYNLI